MGANTRHLALCSKTCQNTIVNRETTNRETTMRYHRLPVAIFGLILFASSAFAECQKAAINPLVNNLKNLIAKERSLLRGAAENWADERTRSAYLRQWGYQSGGDPLASEPKGTRTDLNDALSGLAQYLNSCAN